MEDIVLRPYRSEDETDVLRLNAESVNVLSPMDSSRLKTLQAMCCLFTVGEVDGQIGGFLMGFSDGAAYDSVNYRWFASRLKRFLYIDRVVVSPALRKAGLGTRFYQEAERWAVDNKLLWLAAEVDLQPPNATSLIFHDRLAFMEMGRQQVDGNKLVSLRMRSVGT